VNSDELFEKLPKLLFSGFRNQMLLGRVRAETVQLVLEPLLLNFYEIMLRLPTQLQTDFENILRIYPEIAQRFNVRIKPPFEESLLRFAKYRLDNAPAYTRKELDFPMVAEAQEMLESPYELSVQEGQGFFTTDKGNSVYLEFSYSEKDDLIVIGHQPRHLEIEIHFCGMQILTLNRERPEQSVPAVVFIEILQRCVHGVDVTIREPENANA